MWVYDQSGLHSKTLTPKHKRKRKTNKQKRKTLSYAWEEMNCLGLMMKVIIVFKLHSIYGMIKFPGMAMCYNYFLFTDTSHPAEQASVP